TGSPLCGAVLSAAVHGRLEIHDPDHARDQEQVDQLANADEAESEEPDQAGDDPSGVDAVNAAEAGEAEQPEKIRDPGRFHVGVPRSMVAGSIDEPVT